ncbi:lamina-associated polypeptide 2, isoforms beta/gamma isoform X2 [Latimeria chalumnae]|uniref:lamina-associated polypeptide 2, isoforms beta/gamma isoform X2 n=1 Tax=Latimeria chalumnae TaxID=7897 RepID=UPI00313C83AD
MSEFLTDPSVLTKDKLKSELVANKVQLPPGEQRKDVYVRLYLKHLTAQNKTPGGGNKAPEVFSSDEEPEATPMVTTRNRSGRKATRKSDKPRGGEREDLDAAELSNEELREQLIQYGVNAGPVTATTRKLYESKLQRLIEQGPPIPATTLIPSPEVEVENKQNGNTDSEQYSDSEDELMIQKREPLKSKTKAPVTVRQRRFEHNQVEVRKTTAVDITETSTKRSSTLSRNIAVEEKPAKEVRVSEKDILEEMFPNEAATPTGISATCRRPIRGAAGRPLKFSSWSLEDTTFSRPILKTAPPAEVKTAKTKAKRSIPIWMQVVLFLVMAFFLFLVYQAMETNQGNPFTSQIPDVSDTSSQQ